MTTVALTLTPYRQARLAVYAERDSAIESLMRANPDGMTIGQIARCTGLAYEQVTHAINRLEARGILPWEYYGRYGILRSE